MGAGGVTVSQWLQAIHTRAYRKAVVKRLGSEHSRQDSSLSLKARGYDEVSLQSEQVDMSCGFLQPGCVLVLAQTGEWMCDCREAMDVTGHLYKEESGG